MNSANIETLIPEKQQATSSQLFWTKAELNTQNLRSTSPLYFAHQAISDLFGQYDDRPYLFRITDANPEATKLLILSKERPRQATERWGSWTELATKPWQHMTSQGSMVDFDIRINATVRSCGSRNAYDVADYNRRRALAAAEPWGAEQVRTSYENYLSQRLSPAADILSIRVAERGEEIVSRGADRPGRMALVYARLLGSIRIQDPAMLMEKIGSGFGRSRGLGFGLMCLLPFGTFARNTRHA